MFNGQSKKIILNAANGKFSVAIIMCFAFFATCIFAQQSVSESLIKKSPKGSFKILPLDKNSDKKMSSDGMDVEFLTMPELADDGAVSTNLRYVKKDGGVSLMDGKKEVKHWKSEEANSLRQLGLVYGFAKSDNRQPLELTDFPFRYGRKDLLERIDIPLIVKLSGDIVLKAGDNLESEKACARAKELLLPIATGNDMIFGKVKQSINLEYMPRCCDKKVSAWNDKIQKLSVICSSINGVYGKIGKMCQINTSTTNCFALQNALIKPCEAYKNYFGYLLAGASVIGGAVLAGIGFTFSGLLLVGVALLLVTANVLSGFLAGWLSILGCTSGFFVSLLSGIKGILTFYAD